MKNLMSQLRTALVATVLLAVILCGVYPALVWTIAQALFPDKANGSIIIRNGKIIGSKLIAQNFTDAKVFSSEALISGRPGI